MVKTYKLWAVGWLLILVVTAGSIRSDDQMPPDERVFWLIKALSYDRGLEARTDDTLRLAVVYTGSADECSGIIRAFNEVDAKILDARAIRAEAVQFVSVEKLLAEIDNGQYSGLYIHRSAGRSITSILQVTRSRRLPSLAESIEMVRQGASLGVCSQNGRPKVAVNLRASNAEGMDLSSRLLKISDVIR
jgi:hypothetical protein